MQNNGRHANLLMGRIDWEAAQEAIHVKDNGLSDGILNLYVQRAPGGVFKGDAVYHDESAGLSCAMIGYVSGMDEMQSAYGSVDDLQAVAAMFRRKALDFVYHLEGVFSIFIWDHVQKMGYIVQDQYGSNLPLYYSLAGGFCFSTSLKRLLGWNPCDRRLNRTAVRDFLYHKTIIPNETTLIENIYKLVPGHYLIIDRNRRSVQVRALRKDPRKVARRYAKANLVACIEDRVKTLLERMAPGRLACALSGGFDSTLLLHTVAAHARSSEITAVTVGGQDINEVPQAQKTLLFYPQVAHRHKRIEADELERLPDIVWRLEGYVFEAGIFLQYELARILAANALDIIFLGDGADQQLDRYRFSIPRRVIEKSKQILRLTPLMDFHYRFLKRRRIRPSCRFRIRHQFKRRNSGMLEDPALDFILKKNGLMLNSFCIEGVYPFLDKELKTLSEALGRLNSHKRFYKSAVTRVLGPAKAEHLVKIGGGTDVEYLVRDKLPWLQRFLDSDFVATLLTVRQIRDVKSRPEEYSEFVIQLLYLYLFSQLFVSGRFDSRFSEPCLDIPLSDFLVRM